VTRPGSTAAPAALGLSEAVRDTSDHGEPVLQTLMARCSTAYRDAYTSGAALARTVALDHLRARTGGPAGAAAGEDVEA
jgi:hypothetical protein